MAETVGFPGGDEGDPAASPGRSKQSTGLFCPAGRDAPFESHFSDKKKDANSGVLFLMAETVGFEPTCRSYRQTDFESAPL